jgi:hypothetical protein
MVRVSASEAAVLGVAERCQAMQISLVDRTHGQLAISFHRALIPPTPHELKLDFVAPTANAGPAAWRY